MDSRLRSNSLTRTALMLIISAPDALSPSALIAQTGTPPAAVNQQIDIFIAEAARVFGVPTRWIHAIIQTESARNPSAKSHAGAMGFMQIMPGTWAELRTAYGFGDDPFDPRENILAGTAYLRQMYDRFGSPGFLAAYNAGPGRYQDHLATGRALPQETHHYLAILAPLIGEGTNVARAVNRLQRTLDWRDAPLFLATVKGEPNQIKEAQQIASNRSRKAIFVPRSQELTP